MVTDQGSSVAEAAEPLGIRVNQLYDWKAKIEASRQESALSVDERAELNQLCKENKNLRIEKILIKASAFFAKEME